MTQLSLFDVIEEADQGIGEESIKATDQEIGEEKSMEEETRLDGVNVRECIEGAFEKEHLMGSGEPYLLKIWKQQGIGSPSAFSMCTALQDRGSVIDIPGFWLIESDDLGDALQESIHDHPELWIEHDEEGLKIGEGTEGSLMGTIAIWLDDWVRPFDMRDAAKIPIEQRRIIFGDRDFDLIKDAEELIRSDEFDAIDYAIEQLKIDAAWMTDDQITRGAIMLATMDRSGFRSIDHPSSVNMDGIFDRWAHLA